MKIRLKAIQIGHIARESGIYYGRNRLNDISCWDQRNDGFGAVDGENNFLAHNVEIVMDADGIDQRIVPIGGIPNEQLE